ncbi:hypothetical protein F5X99DRAFT_427470 [Biscogniauxia marginata]|nr:hypothetical protein F5X99DRAFT_427470 [Biscogniauxia marginata]
MLPSSAQPGVLRHTCSLSHLGNKYDQERFAVKPRSPIRIVKANLGPMSTYFATSFCRSTSRSWLDPAVCIDRTPKASLTPRVSDMTAAGHRRRPAQKSFDYSNDEVPEWLPVEEDLSLLLDGNATPQRFCRICHVCSARTWPSTHCNFCGHQICQRCVCKVSESTEGAHVNFSHHPSPAIQTQRTYEGGCATAHSGNHSHVTQQSSTLRQRYHLEKATEEAFKSEETRQERSSTAAAQRPCAQSEHIHTTHNQRTCSIQQNPFLIADKEARARAAECDDPTCRATHDGHYPFRHSEESAQELPTAIPLTPSSESKPVKSKSRKAAPDSGNDTIHRHHSAGFHNTHHIIEHLSAAIGHDAHDHLKNTHGKPPSQTVIAPSESSSRANIEPLRQLEPLTHIQPDVVPPGHPRHDVHRVSVNDTRNHPGPRLNNRAAEATTIRERHLETNASASQLKTAAHTASKDRTDIPQRHDHRQISSAYGRDDVHTPTQLPHRIKHTKPIHFAETKGSGTMKGSPPNGSFQETNKVPELSSRSREEYGKLVNSTFTEGVTHDGQPKEYTPKGRLLSPPSWLQHPRREAADATARLRHIDTRSHGCLEHNHGYLSNIAVEDFNRKKLTRSKSSIHDYETTRNPRSRFANLNHDFQRVAAPSPSTALHLVHQHSSAQVQQNSFQIDDESRVLTPQPFHGRVSKLLSPDVPEIPEIPEPHDTIGETWRESQPVQEHYRKATLRAEAELSKLLSEGHEKREGWTSEANSTSEIVGTPLQPRHIASDLESANESRSHISYDELTHGEGPSFVDRPSDLEIHRPAPIAPPNHDCSWKDRYLALTAEIRLLKAEMSTRAS